MRDHEARAVGAQGAHRLLHQHLSAGVDRARRLVEDEHAGLCEERPGDREQLLLARADVRALVVEHRVVAVGQRVHETVDIRRPGRLEDLPFGRIRPPVGDVLPDRAAEQPRVLKNHPHPAPQVVPRHRRDVDTVERDATGVDLVEPHHQVDERGLARARRAHDRDRLAGLGDQREVLDQRRLLDVPERDVLELEAALRSHRTLRRGRVRGLLVGIQ